MRTYVVAVVAAIAAILTAGVLVTALFPGGFRDDDGRGTVLASEAMMQRQQLTLITQELQQIRQVLERQQTACPRPASDPTAQEGLP